MTRGTILIVDDDTVIRSMLRRELLPQDFTIVEAATGTLALHFLHSKPPDLVLLDYGLPDMTGLDVLRSLPENQREALKVIVITSNTDRGVFDAFMQHGPEGLEFMEKPLDMARLKSSLDQFFRPVEG